MGSCGRDCRSSGGGRSCGDSLCCGNSNGCNVSGYGDCICCGSSGGSSSSPFHCGQREIRAMGSMLGNLPPSTAGGRQCIFCAAVVCTQLELSHLRTCCQQSMYGVVTASVVGACRHLLQQRWQLGGGAYSCTQPAACKRRCGKGNDSCFKSGCSFSIAIHTCMRQSVVSICCRGLGIRIGVSAVYVWTRVAAK